MSVWATYRQLLGNRQLTKLLLGEFVSSIGDWLYLVALVVLVYDETGDPVILGIVGAARLVPYFVLSIPAGVISDRFDRRLILLVSDLARAVCMLLLATWITSRRASRSRAEIVAAERSAPVPFAGSSVPSSGPVSSR